MNTLNDELDEWLTVAQVCSQFVVDEHTVLHWIKSKQLKAVNVGRDPGKKKPRWRIKAEDLVAFLNDRSN